MLQCRVRLKNWDATGHLFRIMRPAIEEESDKVILECEKIYYDEVIRLATEGHPDWPDLGDKWVREKGHDVFYYQTGEFLEEGVELRRIKSGPMEERIFIGATNYKIHRTGLSMEKLAKVLQYNYDRPLFGPAWENVKYEILDKLSNIGINVIPNIR